MAAEARDAFNAGASIMHVHLRMQEEGFGHMPSWDPDVAETIVNAIREACPGVIINLTTGVVGKDITGPLACIRRVKPEIAACNAGSLNYLKIKEDGNWAWPPMVFDNPVSKVQQFLDVMGECGTHPEFECFDVGIVRCVTMYLKAGMLKPEMGTPEYNLVMGVASGMPCDADLLRLLPQVDGPRQHLAGHPDRPLRDLAGASGHRGSRRHAAHRPGRHLLPAGRLAGIGQRRADRGAGRLCPQCRPRHRQPDRGPCDAGSRQQATA
jgi:hypothetical protein